MIAELLSLLFPQVLAPDVERLLQSEDVQRNIARMASGDPKPADITAGNKTYRLTLLGSECDDLVGAL